MQKQKIEFNVGDRVTFNAYKGRVLKAVVRKVYDNLAFFVEDERVGYLLHGVDGDSLITRTGAASIVESQYYTPPTEE